MTITAIVPTYNRPDCMRRNLTALLAQVPPPSQIIVVDASPDDRTQEVVSQFGGVLYLRNPLGRGNAPHSRNLALEQATGDIVAFLDDDAFVHPGWSAALLESYADPTIAAVAGRALNGNPGEERFGVDQIGKFLSDGTLTGNFAADPGKTIEVDHMIGCNMSIRRELLNRIGGFRDDVPAGPFGICEESDMCVRARRMGYRIVFNPKACADHIGAPQPGGKRFSPKYSYYHAKNNLVMIVRNYGVGAMAMAHVWAVTRKGVIDTLRKTVGAFARFACSITGLVVGLIVGIRFLLKTGQDPVRHEGTGAGITSRATGIEAVAVDAAPGVNTAARQPELAADRA